MEIFIVLILILLFVILPGIRVINQYERGVVLTLGRYSGVKNPGLRL